MNRLKQKIRSPDAVTIFQFIIYSLGGVLSAVFDLIITWALLEIRFTDAAAVSLGFFAGVFLNFAYHTKVTFNVNFTLISAQRYCMILMLNYILTISIIFLLQYFLELETIIGKIITLPIIAISGYLASRLWIYEKPFKRKSKVARTGKHQHN